MYKRGGARPYQIQKRFKSRDDVVPYTRIVNAHAKENNKQETAEKVTTKLLVSLPNALSKDMLWFVKDWITIRLQITISMPL